MSWFWRALPQNMSFPFRHHSLPWGTELAPTSVMGGESGFACTSSVGLTWILNCMQKIIAMQRMRFPTIRLKNVIISTTGTWPQLVLATVSPTTPQKVISMYRSGKAKYIWNCCHHAGPRKSVESPNVLVRLTSGKMCPAKIPTENARQKPPKPLLPKAL